MISFGMRNFVARGGRKARIATVMAVVATLVVGLAAMPAAALAPTTVNPAMWQVNGRVRAIIETPNATYIAGQFTALVSPDGTTLVPRTNLAAIDPASGQPLPFVANVNKPVWNIAVSADNSTVYAVGDFNLANGISRKRAAAFDATTGATLAWNPNLAATGLSVAVLGSRVYLGGAFLTVGGAAHAHLAAVDATSGALLTSWSATADSDVETIVTSNDGSKVLVGGLFTSISGSAGATQRKVASLNPTTGALLPWASHPNFEVFKLEVSDTQLFAAAGGSGGHSVAWNLSTGAQQWTGFGDGDAVAVELQNGILYTGGHMTTWNGVATGHVFAVNPATGALLLTAGKPSWTIKINSNLGIFAMDSFQGHLSIGGDFTKVNNLAQQHYARFDEVLDTTAPTTPGQPVASGAIGAASSVNVVWNASHDNVATSIIYNVYRDGDFVGSVTSSSTTTVSYTDTNLAPLSTHTWTIQASDGANLSVMSPASDPFTLPASDVPTLAGLTMLDNDDDGRVDAVRATFSSAVTCTDPCIDPWTLANVPSGGSLASVAVSGNTATLSLNEGTGAQDTSVGAFTIALSGSPSGIVDAVDAGQASFTATAPSDGAGPVPVGYETTNVLTAGFMEPGDTFTVTFSEPIDPATVIAANVKEFDPQGTGTDEINIVGLSATFDLLDDNIILPDKGTVVYQKSTLTMLNGNTSIRSTIAGKCTGTACDPSLRGVSSLQPVTFLPETNLRDFAGNQAGGSFTGTLAIF
jgi:hypothetical protein